MRKFEPSDLPEINRWLQDRSLPIFELPDLPAFGLIEPGIAAGFMYLTNSRLCLIEGLVTNSKASMLTRARAARYIVEKLLAEVGRLSGRAVAIAKEPSIARLAIHHGGKCKGLFGVFLG